MSVDPAREQLKNLLRKTPTAPAEEVTGFDPADHTVDEVKAHVDDHPDELGSVLEAETAGKNRVTLVEWLEAQSE